MRIFFMRQILAFFSLFALSFSSPAFANQPKRNTTFSDATYFDFALSFGVNIWPYINWADHSSYLQRGSNESVPILSFYADERGRTK